MRKKELLTALFVSKTALATFQMLLVAVIVLSRPSHAPRRRRLLRLCHQWRRHLGRLPPDQRSRSLGSRASRSASPNRLKPKTVSAIARPGKTAIHGAVEAYSSAPPCNIRPHAAVGSCTPSPR